MKIVTQMADKDRSHTPSFFPFTLVTVSFLKDYQEREGKKTDVEYGRKGRRKARSKKVKLPEKEQTGVLKAIWRPWGGEGGGAGSGNSVADTTNNPSRISVLL